MATITGNTYPVREQLKALGGQWNNMAKAWIVPNDKEAEAKLLVANAGEVKPRQSVNRGPRTCKDCGCRINYGVYCGKCEYR